MKIAFIGGTRFIGRAAAAWAIERGHDVSVLHRGQHPCDLAAARPVRVDRADPSALSETIARLEPEVVVDTRAMTRPEAEATALALKIVRVPCVVLSSQDVYAQFGRLNGLPAPAPEPIVTESSPLTIPYPFRGLADHEGGPDYDKKDVEAVFTAAVRDGVPSVTILRLCAVYGRNDPQRRFGFAVDRLDAGERMLPCKGGASFRKCHAHVRDVAHAIVLATERPLPGSRVLNVGEETTPTVRERCDAFADAMGAGIEWRETSAPLPDDLELLGVLPNDFVVSTAAIRAALGFAEITTADERTHDHLAWLRASRPAMPQ